MYLIRSHYRFNTFSTLRWALFFFWVTILLSCKQTIEFFPNVEVEELHESPEIEFLTVSFPSDLTGYAGGETGLLKTEDGGQSWAPLAINGKIVELQFFSENTGYAVVNDYNQKLYKTDDGGNSWDLLYNSVEKFHISSESNLFLTRYGDLIKSTDGGQSWDYEDLPVYLPGQYDLLFFFDDKAGLYFGEHDHDVYRTLNGGQSWTETSHYYEYGSIARLNSHRAIWASTAQELYLIEEKGKIFTPLETDQYDIGSRIFAYNEELIYMTGYTFLSASYDGGMTWELTYNQRGESVYFQDMDFIDQDYSVGVRGNKIYRIKRVKPD